MIKGRLLHSYLPGNPLKTTRTLKPSIKSVSGGERPFEEEEGEVKVEEEEDAKEWAEGCDGQELEDFASLSCRCGESGIG